MAIVVKLTGDLSDLEAKLKSAGIKVEEVGDKADKASGHAGKLSGALGGVSKVAGGFVLGSGLLQAPGFLLGAAQAAADDEQATARLQQTVRNLGGDYEETLAQVNAQIDAGQKLAFSDDEVRDSYQFLAQATNSSEEALSRQKIAMDLARGANISLDAASKLVGKTSEENTNTLKKLGIEVADGATEAEVLAGVQARFAGQSDAYAKSTAGQFAQAKLAMGEVVEGIGTAVLPILTKVGTVLAENMPAIQAFVGEFATKISDVLVPALQSFIEFLGPIIAQAIVFFQEQLLPAIQSFMDYMQPKLVELGDWVAEQFAKFKVYYESDIKPALDNIQAGVEAVIAFIAKHWPEIESVITPVMDQVKLVVETAVQAIMLVLGILIDLIGGDFSGAWTKLQELVDTVWAGIKGTIENTIELIKNLAPIMLEAGQALGGALMDGIKRALGAVAGFAGGVADAVLSAVKNVINNYVIDPINRTLEFGFDTHIPGVGTVNINPPDLPRLASGMWSVPGPTGVDQFPALLAGGEMVLPAREAEALRNSITVGGLAGGGGNNTIKIGVASDGAVSDMEKANAELLQLLRLLSLLDDASREMWLADPKNAEFLANLKRAAAGLPALTPSVGDGPVFSPGAEGGGGLPTPSRPVLGGSGATNGAGSAKPPATTQGGALKADEEMLQLLRDIKRNGDQSVDVLKVLLAIARVPQMVELVMKPGALQALAVALIDPLAQIQRRQSGLTA